MELTCDSERAEEVFICLLFARASLLSFNVEFRTLSQRFDINIRIDTSLKVDENISMQRLTLIYYVALQKSNSHLHCVHSWNNIFSCICVAALVYTAAVSPQVELSCLQDPDSEKVTLMT